MGCLAAFDVSNVTVLTVVCSLPVRCSVHPYCLSRLLIGPRRCRLDLPVRREASGRQVFMQIKALLNKAQPSSFGCHPRRQLVLGARLH